MTLWWLVGLAVAALVGVGLVLWRTPPAPKAPPRIERVNLKRRTRKEMLRRLQAENPRWTPKRMDQELRRQLRAERNGDGAA